MLRSHQLFTIAGKKYQNLSLCITFCPTDELQLVRPFIGVVSYVCPDMITPQCLFVMYHMNYRIRFHDIVSTRI
jgi:hypothetical protein